MADSTGAVCYDADFYPYGGARAYTTTCGQNYKFTGKERDAESGLDDFDARFYSSSLGRFMSADWSAIPAPVPYANLTNPQTLNLYAMVRDNPESFVDLNGHYLQAPSEYQGSTSGGDDPFTQASFSNDFRDIDKVADSYYTQVAAQERTLSQKSENAILNSNLTAEQAVAFEDAVLAAGTTNGINPDILVGIAVHESHLNPAAESPTSSAAGLFQLTASVRGAYGLSSADATGSSPSSITDQVNTAASYLHDLAQGPVPAGHPSHQLEIAIGYYRGSRTSVNEAIASKGGYGAMLKLSYSGETLGSYINDVESFQ